MSLRDVTWLTERLEEHYQSYGQGMEEQRPGRKGFARLFRRWFTYNAQEIEPVHQQFLDGTAALVKELAAAIQALPPEEKAEGSQAAARAVGQMVGEKPAQTSQERTLYMIAAEPLCAPLLPLLTKEALLAQRDRMLAQTPRRMMFPKQAALLDEIEALLQAPAT